MPYIRGCGLWGVGRCGGGVGVGWGRVEVVGGHCTENDLWPTQGPAVYEKKGECGEFLQGGEEGGLVSE